MNSITKSRRYFLKASALSGGGLMLSYCSIKSTKPISTSVDINTISKEFYTLNGFVKIAADNTITIMAPNPEGGQGVKTSLPMIVAEELDVDWKDIIIEQADLDTKHFTRQFIGGSQAIHQGWKPLRTAGATARQLLREAAAKKWSVPVVEISTNAGKLIHASGKSAMYGEMAAIAATLPLPASVKLKDVKDFTIIGKSKRNIDHQKIITGQPLFGIDIYKAGMLVAMIVHPPAFGLEFKSIDNESEVRKMNGIVDLFPIKIFNEGYEKTFFDTTSFNEVVAIIGRSTWEVMNAKKAIKTSWEPFESYTENRNMNGRKQVSRIPAGLESTADHSIKMQEALAKPGSVRRMDGDTEAAFASATKIVERTYTAPFLAHNCMEPMNFFAHVTTDKAELSGPLQKPEFTEQALSTRLGMPLEKIDIKMTRLGGGFGRRSYAHWLIEAALISQRVKAPIKLIYTREDDMTSGIYRSAYTITYKAAINAQNEVTALHIKGGGVPESPVHANRFPAGAIDNYLAEDFSIDTNLTVGSFRAPRSNFAASAEQSFLDELAEAIGKDPIDFRLDLLLRAKEKPIGKNNDYDADRYAGVLKLVREKSNWDTLKKEKKMGVAAYFCHDSYAANVVDLDIKEGNPIINKVWCAIDCGIVVNPDNAKNMAEGATVDGIGTALYGKLNFDKGIPDKNNLNSYRHIRMNEAPKAIQVDFVQSNEDPTGMGEPAYPPVFAALANAMYKADGKRRYEQPYLGDK